MLTTNIWASVAPDAVEMMLGSFEPVTGVKTTESGTTEIVAAIARAGAVPGLLLGSGEGREDDWVLLPIRKLHPCLQENELSAVVEV